MQRINITKNCIRKLLQGLSASEAAGPDQTPTRVLTDCASEIVPYLTIIFQQSINIGWVPHEWKHGNRVAIFIQGKRELASNYWPVLLTLVTWKRLGRIIYHALMEHYDKENILVEYQCRFRSLDHMKHISLILWRHSQIIGQPKTNRSFSLGFFKSCLYHTTQKTPPKIRAL